MPVCLLCVYHMQNLKKCQFDSNEPFESPLLCLNGRLKLYKMPFTPSPPITTHDFLKPWACRFARLDEQEKRQYQVSTLDNHLLIFLLSPLTPIAIYPEQRKEAKNSRTGNAERGTEADGEEAPVPEGEEARLGVEGQVGPGTLGVVVGGGETGAGGAEGTAGGDLGDHLFLRQCQSIGVGSALVGRVKLGGWPYFGRSGVGEGLW